MSQVLQPRYVPDDITQQQYHGHSVRSDASAAKPSTDQSASGVGSYFIASNIEPSIDSHTPLPTFDLGPMLALTDSRMPKSVQQLCQAVANCLRDTGCLVVRDPRVKVEDNLAFLNMMERYFAQSTAVKMKDTRPDLHFQVRTTFCHSSSAVVDKHWLSVHVTARPTKQSNYLAPVLQVGATPEGTETPKCMVDPASIAAIETQPAEHRARHPQGADPKWRYMWRIGDRPAETSYSELNSDPVIPAGLLPLCHTAQPCPLFKASHFVIPACRSLAG